MDNFLPTTPAQRDFTNPLVELDEAAVAAWIEGLPLEEPAEAVPMLAYVLLELNREPLAAKDRMRLLERYHRPIQHLFESWERFWDQLGDLPTGQQMEVAEDFGALLLALANGYKIVVREGRQGRKDPNAAPLLLLAIHRALETLGQALLDAFRRYAPAPPHLYRELNHLYRYAEEFSALELRARETKDSLAELSLHALYARAMLLAAADPFRLSPHDTASLYRLLGGYAGLCGLSKGGCEKPFGRFAVDLASDNPPIPCAKLEAASDHPHLRVLDTAPMRMAALERLGSNDKTHSEQELDLLRRLLPGLRVPPQRRSPRVPSQKQVRLAIGIEAAHFFLTEEGHAHRRASVENAVYGIEVYDQASESQLSFVLEPWRVVNESPRGYLLVRRHALNEELRVGEILGLFPMRPEDPDTRVEVGIVRWLRRDKEGWAQVGVEIFPGTVGAVVCSASGARSSPQAAHCALYLHHVSGLGIPPTLIARKSLYQRDRLLDLQLGARHGKARIGSLVMASAHMARMTLKPPS